MYSIHPNPAFVEVFDLSLSCNGNGYIQYLVKQIHA
jgi:hypothetical protein